eukprot:TRINITY_DN15908_c0_g1_i1.p1 TRINITY_DN15908_c0_g1~~TRINITY_DN15908_c0_g1_i1.p1  ORF type:complete len:386 (+),score=77.67 TRINITY_DN15908_c0_g1_i1:84-1160(+)
MSSEQGWFQKVQLAVKYKHTGDRFRYQQMGLDLDLAYITPRIIAMGYPATGAMSMVQNSAVDVEMFFKKNHNNNWLIINCSNHPYMLDIATEDQILNYGWCDIYAPPISHILKAIMKIHEFLSEDPDRVVAVHGFNDQERPGILISCYLVYSCLVESSEEAIQLFNKKRGGTPILKSPSQIRTIENIASLVDWNMRQTTNLTNLDLSPVEKAKPVFLTRILITPIPHSGLKREACKPVVHFFSEEVLFSKDVQPFAIVASEKRFLSGTLTEDFIRLDTQVPLQGDVVVKFYHESRIAGMSKLVALFRIHFHTSFQLGYGNSWLDFNLDQLDEPQTAAPLCPDDVFPSNFRIRMLFLLN